jgi:hypothetical protein
MKLTVARLWLALVLGLVACNIPSSPNLPGSPTGNGALPTKSATAQAGVPEHRIGVRVNNGVGEFYDRQTGASFVPRGMNYVRLAPQTVPDGGTQVYHSVFDPGQYDPAEVSAQFARMSADGYNVVRVFLSQNTLADPAGGLSPAYMQNVADFLKLAGQNGLFVMFTQDWLPGGKYGAVINQDCCDVFNFNNAQDLPAGAVKAYQLFYADFITTLIQLGAPTDSIFSYELRNEFFFDTNYPPLSLKSGNVTTANGKNYDMSSPSDKQKMLEENLPFFIDNVRAAILKLDPTALVSIGFFVPQEPNRARVGDTRLVVSAPAIWSSQADFIDLHAYPGFELNLKQHLENFGVNGMQAKPIILGEFGASVHSYRSTEAAARALMDWQVESCQDGIDGWLLWTWDTPEQYDFYSARSGTGEIEQVLAPANHPDPCSASGEVTPGGNLALKKNVSASGSLPDQPASNAVDGLPGTLWNSGAGPEQWIEIDLGEPAALAAINLTVAQYPAGETVHQIWARGPNENLKVIFEFRGSTTDNQVLEFKASPPLAGIQYVRIVTIASPSWVAWREIGVIAR